jgi:2-keto-4-pentenoate hydratase/2-oxohepta-3-ene-1,7-dioic acid hydratase in catechol pathway
MLNPASGKTNSTLRGTTIRYCTIATPAGPRVHAVGPDGAIPLGTDQPLEALLRGDGAAVAVADAPLLAPLAPREVVAIGLNYQDHIDETGMDAPTSPLVFAKFPSSVVGPGATVLLPKIAPDRVDWEVELAVVIGRTLTDATPQEAMDAVFGYTIGNDVSARDVQFADGQWVRGKSFDTFCPLGPVVVTPDELGDPQALAIRTRVNGELRQDSNTELMIFGVAEILSFCSRSFTLDAGDVVLTGTPWGCGEFTQPPIHLRDGDLLELEIDGIGTLANPVRKA